MEPAAKQEKEAFTAWGKEGGGLQAGLGFRPGEKRAYHHGETVTLVVRVRNVGKEAVKFQYLKQFLDEKPPAVTDADGKAVAQGGTSVFGIHSPVDVTLEPGTEIELESRMHGASGLRYELSPASGGEKKTTKELPLLVGTGKFRLQYEQVLGNSSSGFIKHDPALSKLATGKLELVVEADPPQPKADTPHIVEKPDMKGRMASQLPEKVERVGGEPTQEDILRLSKTFFSKMRTYPDIRFREFFDPRYLKKHGLTDRDIAFEVAGDRGIYNIEVADDNRTVLCTVDTTKDSKVVREVILIRWVIHEGCLYVSPGKAPDPKTGIFTPWILRTKP
ncbi:MAG: sigE 18 [Gemmataceae bacterium]|nr:sigE 18 [Gemmataceae bacterium]